MGKALSCALILLLLCANAAQAAQTRTITDGYGRAVTIPAKVERVICSGPGCLRLLVYLQAQGMAVAADDIESRRNAFDARPYALAHPELRTLPVFGQFRGSDNPERILTLSPAPQVILKTSPEMGVSPQDLERKTGIPVVALNYGDLGKKRPDFYASLRIMAQVVHRQERAEALSASSTHTSPSWAAGRPRYPEPSAPARLWAAWRSRDRTASTPPSPAIRPSCS